MIQVRNPQDIYVAQGKIQNGAFVGRWHFSFDTYEDDAYRRWGTLRVFNDDTLSPGAVWPLHFHREIEVVTYCASGEFRHADERGAGGILKQGGVQHTTVGQGMYHAEINHRPDKPLRFIQMWFLPAARGLAPSVAQKQVERAARTNRLLPLVSNEHPGALPIRAAARVYAAFLQVGPVIAHAIEDGWGFYLYVLEGGPVQVNEQQVVALGAAKGSGEPTLHLQAQAEAEVLLVEVALDQ